MNSIDKESKLLNKILEIRQGDMGITIRNLDVRNTEIYILYIGQISDRQMISESIIKPIVQYRDEQKLSIDKIVSSIIYIDDVSTDYDENKIIEYILEGKSILLINSDEKYIVANTFKVEKRNPEKPEIAYTLKGPKDSFTESLDGNISLIRYRIKDPNLRIDSLTVGKRTKTKIAVIYINDIANPRYVSEIKERINNISIDGIFESGYIQKYLLNNKLDLFPQSGIVERSDMASADILEGKIILIVEGGNLAISVPKLFGDFLDSGDDHYDELYSGIFAKILRIVSLNISLTLSSLYVVVVGFHSDILPTGYTIALASARSAVPINSVLEALSMEFISEVLREASIRLPTHIGPAFGIVGTLVIGQAAVAAGVVSPLMVIIVGLSTIGSFSVSDHTIMNPIRILKFMLICITGIFGLFGFVIGYTIIVVNALSTISLGDAYCSPFAPFNFKDLKSFILSSKNLSKERPKSLNPKDKKRQ
ncbi:spore germination protein [Clostridium aestuarii]|uniref:Spore germination protein n=1 Tax=Clostridium aestuarii TaxID=338193 RepID=A0ABT4D0F3_9CLOT|nr:spore germination protein [Clostridium aestuarii]MCY6484716.1 spore germination protein [Clostridium aestuarii]